MTQFLSSLELTIFVQELAEKPPVWQHLVEHGEQRGYRLLVSNSKLNCWVISWNTGHDTGLHDHDGSSGGVVVVEGIVRESRLYSDNFEVQGNLIDCLVERDEKYERGGTFHFGPYDIHRVRHYGTKPAVTIHAYSPPLRHMGSYGDIDGEFKRMPRKDEDELRPLEKALKDGGSD